MKEIVSPNNSNEKELLRIYLKGNNLKERKNIGTNSFNTIILKMEMI